MVEIAPEHLPAKRHPEPLHDGTRANVFRDGERIEPLVFREVLAPHLDGCTSPFGREAAPPVIAVKSPTDFGDRIGFERPVVVAEQPDSTDEPAARELLRRPVAVPLCLPLVRESLDAGGGGVAIERRTHELRVLGLLVDLEQRLDVFLQPLAEEKSLRSDLRRNGAPRCQPALRPRWTRPKRAGAQQAPRRQLADPIDSAVDHEGDDEDGERYDAPA